MQRAPSISTTRDAIKISHLFINDLRNAGYNPLKACLFGSYAKGHQHRHSDIDLAIWDEKFTGCRITDTEPILYILNKHVVVEIHPFASAEDAETSPFIGEVEKHGIFLLGGDVL